MAPLQVVVEGGEGKGEKKMVTPLLSKREIDKFGP